MNKVQEKLKGWWDNEEQKNPCILASAPKENYGSIPDTEDLENFWTDIDFRIDRSLKIIENTDYYCQATAHHYLDLGASTMTAILGCKADYIDKETIWTHPRFESIEPVFDVVADKESFYYKLIRELTRKLAAACKKGQYIAPFAHEGMTDTLGGLYGVENYLMDLVLKPNEVKRAMEYFKKMWIEAFNDISGIIAGCGNEGGIGWAGIWAPGTTFPIQEDISYMISDEMFREFCIPHVRDIVDAVEYPMYHLDGTNAIAHLDSLLEIPKLRAIQWVPGAGHEEISQWYDLIRRILDSGKSVQVFIDPAIADDLLGEIEQLVVSVGANGLLIAFEREISREQAQQIAEKYADE